MRHLYHPIRSAASAARVAAIYLRIRGLGNRSRRHFRTDRRYDLGNVSRGFHQRKPDLRGDAELLERICSAYNKATQQEPAYGVIYGPSYWWQQIRRDNLSPVMRALHLRDIHALGEMYSNFFRDPCSAGLVGVPYGKREAYFGRTIRDLHRRYYLGDALHTLDYWHACMGDRYSLEDLAGPDTGNPFGVCIDGTLIRAGAAFHHYSAHKIFEHLDEAAGSAAEIGGGFGGMAYYLLRARSSVRYLNFDLPESIALASYYLMKSFPDRKFLLYGEAPLTAKAMSSNSVILMPLSSLEELPADGVDVVFSSHAMSDVTEQAATAYLRTIERVTRGHFLYAGSLRGAEMISRLIAKGEGRLRFRETRRSLWNAHREPQAREVECVYEATNARTPRRDESDSVERRGSYADHRAVP